MHEAIGHGCGCQALALWDMARIPTHGVWPPPTYQCDMAVIPTPGVWPLTPSMLHGWNPNSWCLTSQTHQCDMTGILTHRAWPLTPINMIWLGSQLMGPGLSHPSMWYGWDHNWWSLASHTPAHIWCSYNIKYNGSEAKVLVIFVLYLSYNIVAGNLSEYMKSKQAVQQNNEQMFSKLFYNHPIIINIIIILYFFWVQYQFYVAKCNVTEYNKKDIVQNKL